MKSAARPDFPWLTDEAINWLEDTLQPEWTVLETGAGGSTVFFAQRVKHVITYENDPEWHDKVAAELKGRGLENVEIKLHRDYPVNGLGGAPSAAHPSVDLAFIDGRGRVRSVNDAINILQPGGYLMLDDSDRPWYSPAVRLIRSRASRVMTFINGTDHTLVARL